MKNYFTVKKVNNSYIFILNLIILLFLFNQHLLSQSNTSIGFSAGYAKINMNEVNDDLNDTYKALKSVNVPISSPDELSGGLLLEGNISTKINNIILGANVNYLSSSGNISHTDITGSLEEKYNVSTVEFLGNIGVAVPITNKNFELFFKLYGGYGLASAEHKGIANFFSYPEYNIDVENDVNKGYFAARLQSGIEIKFQQIGLNFSLAYRLANAGVLKGKMIQNGQDMGEQAVMNARGGEINFDYSGILVCTGVSLYLK